MCTYDSNISVLLSLKNDKVKNGRIVNVVVLLLLLLAGGDIFFAPTVYFVSESFTNM